MAYRKSQPLRQRLPYKGSWRAQARLRGWMKEQSTNKGVCMASIITAHDLNLWYGDFASAWGIGAVLLVLVLLIDLAARLAKTKLKQKQ